MTIARAPGKLVLSGAYAVLEGAPAIVAAVDRYARADASRDAGFLTDEVAAAISSGALARAPWFDASPLRVARADGTSRKLGVGSSAAILVASIAASLSARFTDDAALAAAVFSPALAAHRKAQPRGSGIDVAASAFGGILEVRLAADGELSMTPHALPDGTVIEVFACPVSASTADLLERVRALAGTDPPRYRTLLDAAGAGARAAVAARSIADFVAAASVQFDALAALGDAARAAIVTPDVAALRSSAMDEGAAFGPSGAGGGDIAIWIGGRASSSTFRAAAVARGFERIDLAIGARGVHVVSD